MKNASAMTTSKVLAVDLGARRVGIAISDGARTMAFPRPMLDRKLVDVHRAIRDLVSEEPIGLVIVGLPTSLSGEKSAATRAMGAEIEELRAALMANGVELITVDERLSTVEAARRLREAGVTARAGRSQIDSAAATVFLETYLAGARS